MGHYASEMSPTWGLPRPIDVAKDKVDDETLKRLVGVLYTGFNSMSHLNTSNADAALAAARVVDELINKRIAEALSPEPSSGQSAETGDGE